jgi:predicted SnoaL-like aldol condensation-catalyzing enzyme
MTDGLQALRIELSTNAKGRKHNKLHRLLAEGNFVLSVCEGILNGVHSSFYDLFRVADSKIVEHWDTIDSVPPRSEWKNENGKF